MGDVLLQVPYSATLATPALSFDRYIRFATLCAPQFPRDGTILDQTRHSRCSKPRDLIPLTNWRCHVRDAHFNDLTSQRSSARRRAGESALLTRFSLIEQTPAPRRHAGDSASTRLQSCSHGQANTRKHTDTRTMVFAFQGANTFTWSKKRTLRNLHGTCVCTVQKETNSCSRFGFWLIVTNLQIFQTKTKHIHLTNSDIMCSNKFVDDFEST